uniref:Uncharacterized protein n=1 Tax=Anguilla anguilla TaxID=7936 RepID=A0A0E9S2H6_ANGAN
MNYCNSIQFILDTRFFYQPRGKV